MEQKGFSGHKMIPNAKKINLFLCKNYTVFFGVLHQPVILIIQYNKCFSLIEITLYSLRQNKIFVKSNYYHADSNNII